MRVEKVLTRSRGGIGIPYGQVVELADTLALGASAVRHEGSNPSLPIRIPADVAQW